MSPPFAQDMNIANEPPSVVLGPIRDRATYHWGDGAKGWQAAIGPYSVAVRYDWRGRTRKAPDGSAALATIQVFREDGGSVFDWRDLQQIKNLCVGDRWEAVELYPAESRLIDPSNARYLWCALEPFDFGFPGPRRVFDSTEAIAPQRPLPRA